MTTIENCSRISGLILLCILLAFNAALGIAALCVGYNTSLHVCLGKYGGISFGYPTWLLVYGWVEIAQFSILFALAIFGCFFVFVDTENDAALPRFIAGIVFYTLALFQFIWYIVGIILFVTEVLPTCAAGTIIFDFGLALNLIKLLTIVFSVLGSSKSFIRSDDDNK